MKIIKLDPGSAEWLAYRLWRYPASEAPEMLGHGYRSRQKYLNEFGKERDEPNDFLKAKFEQGHAAEKAALPTAEFICGKPLLNTVVGEADSEDLEQSGGNEQHIKLLTGKLSASFDGITSGGDWIWEHKLFSDKLFACVESGAVPLQHRIQMEQQFMLSGADRGIFMISTVDQSKNEHLIVEPDFELRKKILDGWVKFHHELADRDIPVEVDLSEDKLWGNAETEYRMATGDVETANDRLDRAKKTLIDMAAGRNVTGARMDVRQVNRAGSISYSKAIKELGLEGQDFERFRSNPTTYTQIKRRKAE